MSNVATIPEQNKNSVAFTRDDVEILKTTIMPGATDAELNLFGKICAQTGLSPFARQIFPVSRMVWNASLGYDEKKWSFQTSVDGFRLVAQRSGEYEGQTLTQWCGKDGIWKDVWLENDFPVAARVGVYRKNFREPLYATAAWESYVQGFTDKKTKQWKIGTMWQKMPDLMLAKCAECLALRRAFPQELSGIYSQEEMAQSEKTEEPEEKKILAPSGNASPIKAIENKESDVDMAPTKITPKVTKFISPDEFITLGRLEGQKISEIHTAILKTWKLDVELYMKKANIDPENSQVETARNYRGVKKHLEEVESASSAASFNSFSGGLNDEEPTGGHA